MVQYVQFTQLAPAHLVHDFVLMYLLAESKTQQNKLSFSHCYIIVSCLLFNLKRLAGEDKLAIHNDYNDLSLDVLGIVTRRENQE